MNFEINQTELEDISHVIAIAEEGGLSLWSAQNYAAELARADSIFLVARLHTQGRPIGFIVGRLVLASHEGDLFDLEIQNIGVSREYRRHGIGRELFAQMRSCFPQRQLRRFWLEVRSSNQTAIKFYEGLGFTTEYVRKGYYRDPVDDANIMSAVVYR